MSRDRAKRMLPLIKIAKNAVNEALSYIGQLQQSIQSEKEKKDTLINYQSEYQQSFKEKGATGVQGLEIQQFESFMWQIDEAMNKQSIQITQLEHQLKKAQSIYQNLNQKLKSYEKLQERLTNQTIKLENIQLQKLMDEIGSQLHRLHLSS